MKRKKTMNIILLIFVVLAVAFMASSANNLITVSTALDNYFGKAGVPRNEELRFYDHYLRTWDFAGNHSCEHNKHTVF